MSSEKKFLRKCIGCNEYKDKQYLIRVLANSENDEILINPPPKVFGRSVYVCHNLDCIENAFKKMKISKFIRKKINIELKEKIKTVLAQ